MHILIGAFLAALVQMHPAPPPMPPAAPAPAVTALPVGSPAPASSPAAVQPNFGELISSLNNMRSEIAKVQAMNGSSANDIRPVNVRQLNGTDSTALADALSRNQANLAQLRAALGRVTITTITNEHITIAQFLADNKLSLTQVVGADVSNGKMVLFFQK